MAGFLTTIILLGAIQGFIVSAMLWFSGNNRPSNRLLAILILLMALASINIYFLHTGWFQTTTTLRLIAAVIPLIFIMPMGPLIFFYIQSRLNPTFIFTRKQAVHFYPVIIDIVPQLIALVYLVGTMFRLFHTESLLWGKFIDYYDVYSDIPRWISLTVYLWLSYRYIISCKAHNKPKDKTITNGFNWLLQFVYIFLGFQFIWLVYLVPYVIPRYTDWLVNTVDWYPVYIPLAVMIYWLGIKGYLISRFDTTGAQKRKITTAVNLPEEIVQDITRLLAKVMQEEKLYMNPALNLDMVSTYTRIPPKTISAVLNQHLQTNFNEWMNAYRIGAFKQKACQADMLRLTISGIAAECGFSSQATFQRIFKQSVGMTPSQYLKSLPVSG